MDSDAMAVSCPAGMEMDRRTDGKDYVGQGDYGGYEYGERDANSFDSFGHRGGASGGMYSDDEDEGPEIDYKGFDESKKDGTHFTEGAELK